MPHTHVSAAVLHAKKMMNLLDFIGNGSLTFKQKIDSFFFFFFLYYRGSFLVSLPFFPRTASYSKIVKHDLLFFFSRCILEMLQIIEFTTELDNNQWLKIFEKATTLMMIK